MKVKTKIFIKIAVSVLVTVFMVLVSELLGEEEMIFPEVAALAVGSFVSFKMSWNVTPIRMFVLMTVSAFAGYGLSAFVPLPLYIKLLAAMLFSLIVLSRSNTTMLPMISAAVLPVLTNVQSILYPVSVLILTAMIIGIRALFVKYGLADKISFDNKKPQDNSGFIRNIWIFAVFAVVAAAALPAGMTFMLAPPLAVILAEAADPESPVHKAPVRYFLCTVLCTFTGTACRLVFADVLGLPLTIGVLFAAFGAIMLQLLFRKLFPPAAALAVLPFILPQSVIALYPFQAAAGAAIFIGLDVLFAAASKRGTIQAVSEGFVDFMRSIKLFRPEEMAVKPAAAKAADAAVIPEDKATALPDKTARVSAKADRPVRHRMTAVIQPEIPEAVPTDIKYAGQDDALNSEAQTETLPVTITNDIITQETPVIPENHEIPELSEIPEITEEYPAYDEVTDESSEVAFICNEEIQNTEEKLPELDDNAETRVMQMSAVPENTDGQTGKAEFHFRTEESDIDFKGFHLSADEAVPGATAFILEDEKESEVIPSYRLHTEESDTELTAIEEQTVDDEGDAADDSENQTSFILKPAEQEDTPVRNDRDRISPVNKLLPVFGGRKKFEKKHREQKTIIPEENTESAQNSQPEEIPQVKVSKTGNVRRRM